MLGASGVKRPAAIWPGSVAGRVEVAASEFDERRPVRGVSVALLMETVGNVAFDQRHADGGISHGLHAFFAEQLIDRAGHRSGHEHSAQVLPRITRVAAADEDK